MLCYTMNRRVGRKAKLNGIECQKNLCVIVARHSSYAPVIIGAVLGLVSGVLVYILSQKLSEWKRRKDVSTLGIIIINELREEIENGIKIMRAMQSARNGQESSSDISRLLPTKSWQGMRTIPNNVMLRIVAIKPLSEIKVRSDCKNYFEHICHNINSAIIARQHIGIIVSNFIDPQNNANNLIAAENLLKDLNKINEALSENSRKWFSR